MAADPAMELAEDPDVDKDRFTQELKLRVKQMRDGSASEADKQAVMKYCIRELVVCIQQMRNVRQERRIIKRWRNSAETAMLLTAKVWFQPGRVDAQACLHCQALAVADQDAKPEDAGLTKHCAELMESCQQALNVLMRRRVVKQWRINADAKRLKQWRNKTELRLVQQWIKDAAPSLEDLRLQLAETTEELLTLRGIVVKAEWEDDESVTFQWFRKRECDLEKDIARLTKAIESMADCLEETEQALEENSETSPTLEVLKLQLAATKDELITLQDIVVKAEWDSDDECDTFQWFKQRQSDLENDVAQLTKQMGAFQQNNSEHADDAKKEGFIQELKLRVKQMNTSGASEADKQAIVKYCMRELIVCIQQMRNMQHERRVVKQWRNRAETETLMTAQVL